MSYNQDLRRPCFLGGAYQCFEKYTTISLEVRKSLLSGGWLSMFGKKYTTISLEVRKSLLSGGWLSMFGKKYTTISLEVRKSLLSGGWLSMLRGTMPRYQKLRR